MKTIFWLVVQYVIVCLVPAVFIGVTGDTLKEDGHNKMAIVWHAVYRGWALAGTLRLIELVHASIGK